MNSAKINASVSKDGTTIQIQGDSFDVGVLLMHIIQQIAEADERIVFAAFTSGVEKSNKEEILYKSLMKYLQSRRGANYD